MSELEREVFALQIAVFTATARQCEQKAEIERNCEPESLTRDELAAREYEIGYADGKGVAYAEASASIEKLLDILAKAN